MSHSSSRFITASIFVLALSFFSTSVSFGALNAYLKLKGANGKSYIAKPDASGKFSFSDVAPGKYELRLMGSKEYFEAATGESSDSKHKDWIEVMSWSWGSSNSGSSMSGSTGRGREASTPALSEIVVTKQMDAARPGATTTTADASPASLSLGCAKGNHIPSTMRVSLDAPSPDGGEYYKIVLQEVMVSSVCSPSGAVKGSWNLKENVK